MTEGVMNSYAQVFFSLNRYFGFFLLVVTFFNFTAGLSGLAAILIVQAMSWFFNFSRDLVQDGTYTYNAMLTGLAVGSFYQLNFSFLILLIASSVLAFLFTLWYLNALGKKNLPVLTIPFLATVWVILLGASNFTALHASLS